MTTDQHTFLLGGDLAVNRLGFGAMRLTDWQPPADPTHSIAVARRAVELGVTFIDTADSYALGANEELLADALHPYPDDLVIATKAGQSRPSPTEWKPLGGWCLCGTSGARSGGWSRGRGLRRFSEVVGRFGLPGPVGPGGSGGCGAVWGVVCLVLGGHAATAHPAMVERSPRTASRARLCAAARRLKSASILAVPRIRARRPPWRWRIRWASFRSTFGRVAR